MGSHGQPCSNSIRLALWIAATIPRVLLFPNVFMKERGVSCRKVYVLCIAFVRRGGRGKDGEGEHTRNFIHTEACSSAWSRASRRHSCSCSPSGSVSSTRVGVPAARFECQRFAARIVDHVMRAFFAQAGLALMRLRMERQFLKMTKALLLG